MILYSVSYMRLIKVAAASGVAGAAPGRRAARGVLRRAQDSPRLLAHVAPQLRGLKVLENSAKSEDTWWSEGLFP